MMVVHYPSACDLSVVIDSRLSLSEHVASGAATINCSILLLFLDIASYWPEIANFIYTFSHLVCSELL